MRNEESQGSFEDIFESIFQDSEILLTMKLEYEARVVDLIQELKKSGVITIMDGQPTMVYGDWGDVVFKRNKLRGSIIRTFLQLLQSYQEVLQQIGTNASIDAKSGKLKVNAKASKYSPMRL